MGTLALLEVLDRDGHVRHSVGVTQWPLRAGRALDNELVLDDPHVAAQHFHVEADDEGQPVLVVGDTVNGLQFNRQKLDSGARVPVGDAPATLAIGRTVLRLRLATHALPAEQRLATVAPLARRVGSMLLLVLAVAGLLAFDTYLVTEPSTLTRTLATSALTLMGMALAWCGFMSVLSKVFTRQAHFGWHLRVLLSAVVAWQLIEGISGALAFMFSWPWVSDFSFLLTYTVIGAALYHHMLAIEPAHPKRWRIVGTAAAVAGIGLSLWFNHQNTDRLGRELYMTHLLPPAFRLATPVPIDGFVKGLGSLQKTLDEKAKQEDPGDDDAEAAVEEDS
jgi:pSer/pThr/pTyr-binding forkhead associated (FHA) protein